VSSSHEITWSGAATGSAAINSEATAVGIRGTAGAIGIPGAEGIIDRVLRERRAETGLSRLSGLFGLSCWPDRKTNQRTKKTRETRQTSKEPRRIGGERIRRGLIAERTTVGAEGIIDAVQLEGASGSVGIGRGIRIVRIRAQLAEIFRVNGERQWQQ